MYDFLQNLSEEVSARTGVSLILSIPKSQREMSPEDEDDLGRLQKLADRVGKAYVLSEGLEIAEIIRRRLFEDIGEMMQRKASAKAFSDWLITNREKLPTWFPVDNATQIFEATFPFHPLALSVFERKWQGLPQFQRTRGVLRMFALWVSNAYSSGFSGAHKDAVIALGSAPFENPFFRAEIFDQLGQNLEAAVTSDIAGGEVHATRLDLQASNSIKSMRLHRKAAATIFFECSGGQVKQFATEPEIRLGVGEPGLDVANVETVLEDLTSECYHLTGEGKRYWISPSPNLNKLLADRRANIDDRRIKEMVEDQVTAVFTSGAGVQKVFFPADSGQIPDTAAITLVVLKPDQSLSSTDKSNTMQAVGEMTKEHGTSSRTFKSALVWSVADGAVALRDEARKLLAWEAIQDEADSLRLSETQQKYLKEQIARSKRDLKEAVWRSYKNVLLLGKDGGLKRIDLGLVHSSASESMLSLILTRLSQEGDLEEESISPNFLVRNWPPALPEWSTKVLRDTFFAAPQFPRLAKPDSLKRTIGEGVGKGLFGYAERAPDGDYINPRFEEKIFESDVEISEETFILTKETAKAMKQGIPPPQAPPATVSPGTTVVSKPEATQLAFTKLTWEGRVPSQKWTTFYTKVLSRFPVGDDLNLIVRVEARPKDGLSKQKVDETKTALRELGLSDELKVEDKPKDKRKG